VYRRNLAGQVVGFVAIDASTGAAMTGTTGFAAFRVLDGGAQASATGTVADKGNGQYSFALSQADVNADVASLLFTMTGMIPVEKTLVTTDAVIDAILSRDVANVESTMPEHCLGTVILATLQWGPISGSTWPINRTNGTTVHATKAITVAAGQITGVN
jgi:hypothetical protein